MYIIKVNDKFGSFDELEEIIREYSRRNYVNLHKRDEDRGKRTNFMEPKGHSEPHLHFAPQVPVR